MSGPRPIEPAITSPTVWNLLAHGTALSPAQITANTDNYSPTGWADTVAFLRLDTDASRNLTGLAAPSNSQAAVLINVGSNELVLVHDATSTAANRFLCPNGVNDTVQPNEARWLWYDTADSRWRVLEVGSDEDLAAIAALSGTGLLARTAADTWALRTIAGPAAGISVADGDGVSGNPTLSLANDLSALEALGSTGLAVRTGSDTWAQRTIAGPAAGISVADGDGVSGNPTLSLANDLAALEALGATGLAVRTGSDTWAQRTITGTANHITVTDGDGVSGNPTLSLPSTVTLTGQLNVDNLRLDGNTLSSQDANGNITLSPNGTGLGDCTRSFRVQGGSGAAASGAGVEIDYAGSVGYVTAFDRGATAWRALVMRASSVALSEEGVERLKVDGGFCDVLTGTPLRVQDTTASTSTTTGCARFAGGIGVAGDVYCNELVVNQDPGITHGANNQLVRIWGGTTDGASVLLTGGAKSGDPDYIYVRADQHRYQSQTSGSTFLSLDSSRADFTVPVQLPSYTVAGLPSGAAGDMAYCSNETGGAVPVFHDGTNWRRVTDRSVAS